MSELDVGGVELDFVGLVSQGYSKDLFTKSAITMLGDNWQEDGEEIMDSYAPEQMSDFKRYLGE